MFIKIYSFIKANYVLVILYLSVFLSTLFFSPSLTLYMLIVPTVFFLYMGKYKDILFLWIFFFFNWYFMFTLLFINFEGDILIGGKYTEKILYYLGFILIKCPFLERFCLETVFTLHLIAESYGVVFHIPSIFKGLFGIFKAIFGGKGGGDGPVGCSPDDKPTSSSSSDKPFDSTVSPGASPTDISGWKFFRKVYEDIPSPKSPKEKNFTDTCENLRKAMASRKFPWNYSLANWESEDLDDKKTVVGIKGSAPDFKFIPKSLRGTKMDGCFEIEGPLRDFFFKKNGDNKDNK